MLPTSCVPVATAFLMLLTLGLTPPATAATATVQDKAYWYASARATLQRRVSAAGGEAALGTRRARNVLLFVGDGLGLATSTAARILRGQRRGNTGEENDLVWDTFPAVALAKTYNSNAQTGESSACATALLCGVKANFETVGVDATARFDDCASVAAAQVPSLLDWAQREGLATGLVTNTRATHATPAALYAHAASRYWEDDGKVPTKARHLCKDIARQLVEDSPGRNVNVILGGGRRHWLPKVARDPERPGDDGRRLDGRNLVDDWLRDKKRRGLAARYVWTRAQLGAANLSHTDHLLGLFAYSHMDFEADRDDGPDGDPSLAEMTRAALVVLRRNPRGFFLFVEGGRIDHAHHYNNAYRALDETLALEAAVAAALKVVDLQDTLVVVTADHSNVLTFGGQATPRGHPILGGDSKASDVDGLPYSTLLYGNGPGHSELRVPLSDMNSSRNTIHAAAAPRHWATHGGEDVAVWANGPLATTLFGGTLEQSTVPHAVAYAACWAEHSTRCSHPPPPSVGVEPPGVDVVASSVMADDTAPVRSGAMSATRWRWPFGWHWMDALK